MNCRNGNMLVRSIQFFKRPGVSALGMGNFMQKTVTVFEVNAPQQLFKIYRW